MELVELYEAALERSRRTVPDTARGDGRPFGVEQPAPPNASASDRLAAFMGRRVPESAA